MADVGVIIYPEQEAIIQFLTDEQRGRLLSALFELAKGDEPTPDDKMVAMALTFFKMRHTQNKQHYEDVRKARSAAGKKHTGNQYTRAKEKQENANKVEQMEQNGTNGSIYNNNSNYITHSNTNVLSRVNSAHACEGYAQELLLDEIFTEQTAMQFHTTPDNILILSRSFNNEQSIKQTAHADYNDYRRHAFDWMRIQMEKREKKDKNGNPNDNIRQAQERQLARLNKIAARDGEVRGALQHSH